MGLALTQLNRLMKYCIVHLYLWPAIDTMTHCDRHYDATMTPAIDTMTH
jgi:hypothetical protein